MKKNFFISVIIIIKSNQLLKIIKIRCRNTKIIKDNTKIIKDEANSYRKDDGHAV